MLAGGIWGVVKVNHIPRGGRACQACLKHCPTGAIAEDPTDPLVADSFFDVFFEVDGHPDGTGYGVIAGAVPWIAIAQGAQLPLTTCALARAMLPAR